MCFLYCLYCSRGLFVKLLCKLLFNEVVVFVDGFMDMDGGDNEDGIFYCFY